MKRTIRFTRWHHLPWGMLMLLAVCACAPKVYIDTYADSAFDPNAIHRVILVVNDTQGPASFTRLFAETFVKTALQGEKAFIVRDGYVFKSEMKPEPAAPKTSDAMFEISLTHCYPGNQSRNFPTSVGATAKLIDEKSRKTLWTIDYAYASPRSGASAPLVEAVMHRVAEKILESVPVQGEPAGVPAGSLPQKGPSAQAASRSAEPARQPVQAAKTGPAPGSVPPAIADRLSENAPLPTASQHRSAPPTGPYVVHIASVRQRQQAERFIDGDAPEGIIRISSTVQQDPQKTWYRLLIGRFKTPEASKTFIRTLTPRDIPTGYAKPMKLPYALLVSSGRPLEPSRKIVEALRKIDYMAYLSPCADPSKGWDVLVGAYESKSEADQRAKLLLANGIPVNVVTP